MIKSYDRNFGIYNISIATSLAIEGATHTGEYDDANAKDFPLRNKLLMVNLRTLFRNAMNAFPTELQNRMTIGPLIDSVREDMDGILSTLKSVEPDCVVSFYYCTYKKINDRYQKANFYNATTDKQKAYRALEEDFFKNMEKVIGDIHEVTEYEIDISASKPTVLLTHHPIDLLSVENFPSLSLLESHTGKVKGPSEWTSKLTGKPEMIPFSKMTLTLFGDGVVFAPQPIKFRKMILELAKKYKWNYKTSDTRIIEAVKRAYEPHLVKLLRELKK